MTNIHYKHRYMLSSRLNCDEAFGIISPYQFPNNYKHLSQKRQTLRFVKKFLESDEKLKEKIVNEIYRYETRFDKKNLVTNWCLMKNQGICNLCEEWNHDHNVNCENHPVNMARNSALFFLVNNQLEIFPEGVDNIIGGYLFT